MHEMLTPHFETVATPNTGAVLGLQIKQAVNYEYKEHLSHFSEMDCLDRLATVGICLSISTSFALRVTVK